MKLSELVPNCIKNKISNVDFCEVIVTILEKVLSTFFWLFRIGIAIAVIIGFACCIHGCVVESRAYDTEMQAANDWCKTNNWDCVKANKSDGNTHLVGDKYLFVTDYQYDYIQAELLARQKVRDKWPSEKIIFHSRPVQDNFWFKAHLESETCDECQKK